MSVQALAETIDDAIEAEDGDEVRDAFRQLIERVDFTPLKGLGRFDLTVHGKLDQLMQISSGALNAKNPRALAGLWGDSGCGSPIRAIPQTSFAA